MTQFKVLQKDSDTHEKFIDAKCYGNSVRFEDGFWCKRRKESRSTLNSYGGAASILRLDRRLYVFCSKFENRNSSNNAVIGYSGGSTWREIRTRATPGSAARSLVTFARAHGGDIWLEKSNLGGLKAVVRVPV